ncbi:hypothetical protein AMTR_s00060p00140410 [Amborella trichopoda]|uniref:Uncharacterized protein n=1 Tax=Amborella trichopoda TaxID=13333 RepID=W1NJC7_AMBTC|nr:hypothetical protein AMTR_s00060p00140410 [Amborella trichopoda]
MKDHAPLLRGHKLFKGFDELYSRTIDLTGRGRDMIMTTRGFYAWDDLGFTRTYEPLQLKDCPYRFCGYMQDLLLNFTQCGYSCCQQLGYHSGDSVVSHPGVRVATHAGGVSISTHIVPCFPTHAKSYESGPQVTKVHALEGHDH